MASGCNVWLQVQRLDLFDAPLEQVEEGRVPDAAHLDRLGEPLHHLALAQRAKQLQVDDDAPAGRVVDAACVEDVSCTCRGRVDCRARGVCRGVCRGRVPRQLDSDGSRALAGGRRPPSSCRSGLGTLMAVLPPTDESSIAIIEVGTCTTGTPRMYVAATYPVRSPTTPPTGSFREGSEELRGAYLVRSPTRRGEAGGRRRRKCRILRRACIEFDYRTSLCGSTNPKPE